MKHWPIIALLTVASFLHFYKLNNIPPGLSNDEANIGYEAWSIATTGRDQWGNLLPLVFQGFGNWSLPIYIYLTVPFVWIFGPTIPAVRAISALSYLAIMVLVYIIVKKLRPKIALSATAMTAATPWIYGLTRVATEVPLAMAFFLLSLYFYLESFKRRHLIIAATVVLMLSVFTYYGMWLFVGLFCTFLIFANRTRTWNKRHWIVLLSIAAISALLVVKISLAQRGNARLNQVKITRDVALVGQLNAQRGACEANFPALACKIFFNKPVLFIKEFTANYLSHFSIREWFILDGSKGILPPGGYFLLVQAPLMLLGLWALLAKGTANEKMIFLPWIVLSPIADSLTGPGNFSRAFVLAPVVSILSAYSIITIPKSLAPMVWSVLIFSWVGFQLRYFSYFPIFHSLYTHYEYQPLMKELNGEKLPVYISSRFRDTKQYIFYLFYNRVSPVDFQRKLSVVKEIDQDGWVWVKQIENFNFVKSLPQVENLPPESIIAGATKEEIEPIFGQYKYCTGVIFDNSRVVNFLNNDPAFTIVRVYRSGEIICPG